MSSEFQVRIIARNLLVNLLFSILDLDALLDVAFEVGLHDCFLLIKELFLLGFYPVCVHTRLDADAIELIYGDSL